MMSKRIYWVDFLRAFASFCVVLCHVTENVMPMDMETMTSYKALTRVSCFLFFTIGRLGVPIFLLIFGYLLLRRQYDTDGCLIFWKTRWVHLLVITHVWYFIYILFQHFFQGVNFSFIDLVRIFCFTKKNGMPHTWFMPMLLGMYALYPFFANALNSVDTKLVLYPMLFYFFYIFICPTLISLSEIAGRTVTLIPQIFLGYGGAYGIYSIAGFSLGKIQNRSRKKSQFVIMWFVLVCNMIIMVYLQFLSYKNSIEYRVWYDSPFLFVSAIAIALIVMRGQERPLLRNLWEILAKYAFPVYLVHYPILYIFLIMIRGCRIDRLLVVVFLTPAVLLASIAVSTVIERVPKVGKYLLYLK